MSVTANRAKKLPTRRNTELFLLVLALGVTALAEFLVSTTAGSSRNDQSWLPNILVLGAFGVGVNISLRIWAKYADPYILPVLVALNGIGLAMIHRLDLAGPPELATAATSQLLYSGVGMASAVIILWVIRDHRVLRKFTYVWLAVSVVLLLLPMVPGLGFATYGARIWIRIGSFSVQPGEFAKVTLAIFFASYLASKRDLILLAGHKIGPLQLPRYRDLAPMLIAWCIAMGIMVLQTDLGSALMFFGLFMVMIYVATGRISWILIGGGLVALGGLFAYIFMRHVRARFQIWYDAFNPDIYYRDPGGSYQVVQGLFGMAHGGLGGTGLGAGSPERIPVAKSDMIYAALGEEIGLVGLFAVVMFFLLFASRGIRAGLGARDGFGKLLATGLSFAVAFQFFIVTGGVLRIIPLTGLTTPFMSAGGSSLLANWVLAAVLLLISHNARRPATGGLLTSEDDSLLASKLSAPETPSALDAREDDRPRPESNHTSQANRPNQSNARPGAHPAARPSGRRAAHRAGHQGHRDDSRPSDARPNAGGATSA
ncbi:hypothetical protein HMPREF3160_05720 [Arthrobacter sp. HMSC06H05]|uniref:FtsW/RodA/SpoVE family cell cycle protein n=1 Tax=Arthrobacter sp. HMSC06H05 TaxID=1581128 RepID=UPI0008A20D19|nr:FtsW/RodA/SpoVE family cell cycle protein [Arthrobacter sp. HMSC06H05]OFT42227.1 hypothetical protein HMPREF3160_05720 [Arthrobacter sp. HMSC06H05]